MVVGAQPGLVLCSRELIGYAVAPHMRASLAIEAITAAHSAELMAGNAFMRISMAA